MIYFIISTRCDAVLKVSPCLQTVEQNASIEFAGVETYQILATLRCFIASKKENIAKKQKHFCACYIVNQFIGLKYDCYTLCCCF